MTYVTKLAPYILKWEGGFVDDPDDLGGATNKGITIKTFKYYRKLKGLPEPTVEDLKNISDAEWNDVLKSLFWDKFKADKIENQNIANILVDWFWGSGYNAINHTQRLLGVTVDGVVGNNTIEAINKIDPYELFFMIKGYRIAYLWTICDGRTTNFKYLKGWLNRLNDLKYTKTN